MIGCSQFYLLAERTVFVGDYGMAIIVTINTGFENSHTITVTTPRGALRGAVVLI